MKKLIITILLFIISFSLSIKFNANLVFATPPKDSIEEIIRLYFINEKEELLNKKSYINLLSIISNENLADDLIFKYKFLSDWNKKFNYNLTEFDYNLTFLHIESNQSSAKVYLKRDLSAELNSNHKFKSLNEEYIFILNFLNGSWKINAISFKEENEDFFLKLKNLDLNSRENLIYKKSWENNYKKLDSIFKEYSRLYKNNENLELNRSEKKFNNIKSANYSMEYALNYNDKFKNFDTIGGDCTNFVSQCLNAGGLETNNNWTPYSTSWINVNSLRDYLVYNSLAKETNLIDDSIIGSPVQFYNKELQRYSHSGIFTVKLQNNDYGYCAHSYNKLNYPLSQSYPVVYDKIRILKIKY